MVICIYVDDIFIFCTYQDIIKNTNYFLLSIFDMKDMGITYVILGIKIKRENNTLIHTHMHYIEHILKKINQ